MKGFLKFVIIISVFGLIVHSRYRDVTGVFFNDLEKRTTTDFIIIHHDVICRDCSIKEIDDFHRDSCGWGW